MDGTNEEVELSQAENKLKQNELAETEKGGSAENDTANKKKKSSKVLPIVIALVAVAAVIGGAVAFLAPGNSKLTKEDFLTSSMLEEAIEIENLSTAEFVYNGIAEHYREVDDGPNPLRFLQGDDPVDYRICYKASVKAGINMKDVEFVVNEPEKIVVAKLPEIALTCTVIPDAMQFIPENTDADMQSIFAICQEDVIGEAEASKELYATAEENLQSVVKALTLPILDARGYSLEWTKGE